MVAILRSDRTNPIDVSQTIPQLPPLVIGRDNMLFAIEDLFSSGYELVIVEGEEGIGKTTLLRQFAEKKSPRTAALFVRPSSRFVCDLGNLRFDLCNQLNVFLRNREIEVSKCSESFLNNQLLELGRMTRDEPFFFVVDGIGELRDEAQRLIMNLLPIGLRGLRFLLSGNTHGIMRFVKKVHYKPYPLAAFTVDEAQRYLADSGADEHSTRSIWTTCRGLPGYLSGVRRVLLSGTDIRSFIADMPSKMPGLFEIEWRSIPSTQPRLLNLLAVLVYDRRQLTVSKLAAMASTPPNDIRHLLESVKFVSIDPRTEVVHFISDQFRRFAENKLSHLRSSVMKQVIDDLLNQSDAIEQNEYLPEYYKETGQYSDLLSLLSPEHFTKMMEHRQSLGPIQQRIDMAVKVASEMNRDADLFKFSLQRSSLSQIGELDIWRSEIDALMALSRKAEAIAIAQSPVLREERLQLLAAIAKAETDAGQSPKPELADLIRQLWEQADPSVLGQKAMNIASDLVCCMPSLAVEMVEKASMGLGDSRSVDEDLAQLLTIALQSKITGETDPVHAISQKMRDPRTRFLVTVASAVARYSASQVLGEAGRLEKVDDKLLLLRQWTKVNRQNEEAQKVVDSALDLIIHAGEYTPNARVFRELASPLPHLNEEACRKMVCRFDGHSAQIEKHGPTEEYVRLQLILAQAMSRWDRKVLTERVVEIWCYIECIQDHETKCTCLAWLRGFLKDLDPDKELESEEGLHSLVRDSLDRSTEILLSSTAEHFSVTRRVIRALAEYDLPAALSVVRSYNTLARRDLGLIALVSTLTSLPANKVNPKDVSELIPEVRNPIRKDELILDLMEYLAKQRIEFSDRVVECKSIIGLVMEMDDASLKCRALCFAYQFLASGQNSESSDLLPWVLEQLHLTWEAIDAMWVRVDAGFHITSEIAPLDMELAHRYFDMSSRLRADLAVNDWSSAVSYLLCVRLAIRAYSGLLRQEGRSQETDMKQLEYIIERIPSAGEKARLWSVVALYCYLNKQSDNCRTIVAKYVKPHFGEIADRDRLYKNSIMVSIAPALFVAHRTTALEMLISLPMPLRDNAYLTVCDFLFTKTVPDDPYVTEVEKGLRLSYEDSVDICELCSHLDEDLPLYSCIRQLSESIAHHGDSLTPEQKTDLVQRIERLIGNNLPDLKNITHQGYVILSQAALEHTKATKHQQWNRLIEEAKQIPNAADRVLVLSMIVSLMPSAQRTLRDEVFEFANQQLEGVSSLYDRLEHQHILADVSPHADDKKRILEMVMKASLDKSEPRFDALRRRLVDVAYRTDPDLAERLVSLTDQNPARLRARNAAREAYEVLRVRREMAEGRTASDFKAIPTHQIAEAAWRNLGCLNAGRIRLMDRARTRQMLEKCSTLSFYDAYPFLSWLCQNLILSCPRDPQGLSTIGSLFEATILGADLIVRLSLRSPDGLRHSVDFIRSDSAGNSSVLLGPGGIEEAQELLRNWLGREQPAYLKLCDPYFDPEDLWVLKLVAEQSCNCRVQVLASRSHHVSSKIETPWSDSYLRNWRKITELDPPDAEIVMAAVGVTGRSPIHDRWLVSDGRGLRFGGSFSTSLGGKYTDISYLSADESCQREALIDGYLSGAIRSHAGEKIRYERFSL